MGIFFVQGSQGRPMLVNARARQLLGQREDPAAGIDHLPAVYRLHRADGSPYPVGDLPVTKALREGVTTMADDIFVHRIDGREVPLITWAAPVDLEGKGQADAAVWVLEDLSALKKAETAKRESEARLSTIIETMAEGLMVTNQAGVVVECNPAACAILGVAHDRLLGHSFLEGLTALREDGTPMEAADLPDRFTVRTGSPVRNLTLGFALDGSNGAPAGKLASHGPALPVPAADIRWLLVNAMPMATQTFSGETRIARVVLTFSDITAQRRALAVVAQAKEKYQMLVDTLPILLLQFDCEGTLIYGNPAAQKFSGYSQSELFQAGFWLGRIHPDDALQFQTLLTRSRAGYHARSEFRFQARDESWKIALALAQPFEQDNRRTGSTCLIIDMTLQRRLENELQKAQRLELVGRLASGTVHDFNNLVTIMVGLAHFGKETLGPDHPFLPELEKIVTVGEQASHLAGQLLAFSKHYRLNVQPVDLNEIVRYSLKILGSVVRVGITIKHHLPETELTVMGDANQLKQVLLNLCLNARDAMPHGGTLTVRAETVAAGDVPAPTGSAVVAPQVSWVRLTIEDTGEGMDEHVLQRLFEPFFSTKSHGTGLGLVVVRQIIEAFGGRISIHSRPGQGTRVDVFLRCT